MFADKGIDVIKNGSSENFVYLYFGGQDKSLEWTILNSHEKGFFDETGRPIQSLLISFIDIDHTTGFDDKTDYASKLVKK